MKPPKSLDLRMDSINGLIKMFKLHESEFVDALHQDLGRPSQEALGEILNVCLDLSELTSNLLAYTSPTPVRRTFISLMDTCYVDLQPLGKVLIIGAWNYPIQLTFLPLGGALAAGNAVIIKPSELAPATERLIAELLPKFVDSEVCQVFTGSGKETADFIDRTKFDFIFYSGGHTVGRLILSQAAKTLTPVALELGGKCPAYVDKTADLSIAAKRILWSKFMNAGQTCVAADYVICHESVVEQFEKLCVDTLHTFYGDNFETSKDYSRIVNARHHQRIVKLLESTQGRVLFGGSHNLESLFIQPTLIVDVDMEDPLMEDEIFGPILPIISVNSSEKAIHITNKMNKPLAVYVFSDDKNVFVEWKENTSSGAIVHNECLLQLIIPGLPFGGVGDSGMGRYRGKASVDLFSNHRSVLEKSKVEFINNRFRYPPYSSGTESWLRWLLKPPLESICSIS